MYVDDTSLSYRSDDIHQLNEANEPEPYYYLECLKGNKLSLNAAKEYAMVISIKRQERYLAKSSKKFSLNIQQERIDVLTGKYLGI